MTRELISMACRLLLSPKDCHIYNCRDFWQLINPLMDSKEIYSLFEYCANYAMYILRQEETIMFSQVKLKYRVMLDLQDAHYINTFAKSHLEQTPHVIQLTGSRIINNIPFYLSGKRSIVDYKEFNRRFDMATGGALRNVDLASIGAAVTGSILIPCVHKSPLEELFGASNFNRRRQKNLKYEYMIDTPTTMEDVAFMNYLEYYYPSYVSLSDADYIKQVCEVGQTELAIDQVFKYDTNETLEKHVYAQQQRKQAMRENFDKFVEQKRKNIEAFAVDTENPEEFVDVNDSIEEKNKDINTDYSDSEDYESNSPSKKTTNIDDINDDIDKTLLDEAALDSAALDSANIQKNNEEKNVEEKDIEECGIKLKGLSIADGQQQSTNQHSTNKQSFKLKRVRKARKSHRRKNKTNNTDKPNNADKANNADESDETKEPKLMIDDKTIAKIEYNQLADIDISITTLDFEAFRKNVKYLYDNIKKNCAHRGPVYIKEIHTIASIKYKIYGPGIPRPMDIFRIPYDPAKMVKKFHVHAVKMFYDGKVTMFRSCMACLLSGVGESYKWFSCNKNPADVLLKYAQRGISIIMNTKELNTMREYMLLNPRWKNLLSTIKIKNNNIAPGPLTYMHAFFRSGLYDAGIRLGLRTFESDVPINNNVLCMTQPSTLTSYGLNMICRDVNKWYVPDVNLIAACLDHVEREQDNPEDEI